MSSPKVDSVSVFPSESTRATPAVVPSECTKGSGMDASAAAETPQPGVVPTRIQILGDGRARNSRRSWGGYCCNYLSSVSNVSYGLPRPILDSTDSHWDACIAEFALDPERYGEDFEDSTHPCLLGWGTDTCEEDGFLSECPAPPTDEGGCASCVMADDGVCDEPNGTGLCEAGCDPVDCACETDQADECDEPQNGGACPYGSDPDCW